MNLIMDATIQLGEIEAELAAVITKTTQHFLKKVHTNVVAVQENISPEFLVNFIEIADRFSHSTSQNVAWILLQHSKVDEVRRMSEGALIGLIRGRCFESLDSILLNNLNLLAQQKVDIRGLVKSLSDSRLRTAFADVKLGAHPSPISLPTKIRESSLVQIVEYLRRTDMLVEMLIEYALTRLDTAAVTEWIQTSFSKSVCSAVHEPLIKATGAIEGLSIMKRRAWEKDYTSESRILNEITQSAAYPAHKRHSVMETFMLGLLFAVPAWLIVQTGTTSLRAGLVAGILAIGALVCLLRAVLKIIKNF
jgi:hypothetical protein